MTQRIEKPTDDEIQRVRRWECVKSGHYWDAIMRDGEEFPIALVCKNCGARAKVTPE